VDRLNINNNFKDPSIMRERLAYTLSNELDIESPRTAYAEVYVDGDRHGVYTMVQQVDKRYLKERFGTDDDADDGNLYKCYDGCPLEYWGDDKDAYTINAPGPNQGVCPDGECGLTLKTNEDDEAMNTYEDIFLLTRTIQEVNSGLANLEALEAIFDLEHYARFQAFNLVLSNLDSYFVTTHNFYLYHRPADDRFQFIPWDVNEAYGNFGCMGAPNPFAVLELDLLEPCDQPGKPLAVLIEGNAEMHAMYCDALDEFMGSIYSVSDQDDHIAALHALVDDERQENSIMGQPPSDYTYQQYMDAQTHNPSQPGQAAFNLGFFNDERISHVETQIGLICQGN
jgi:spore coat protein CotH